MSDPSGPSLWEVMMVDPAIPIDQATMRLVIRDQRSRSILYPGIRILSRVTVTLIVLAKQLCPVRFSAHATMDKLCLWFLRRFVAPDAVTLLIRHFIVETDLLNFCVRNAGLPRRSDVTLRPSTLGELGDRAVIEHDLNVYRVVRQLGCAGALGPSGSLDFGTLDIPGIDPEPHARRLLSLDIQTALCLMNVPFALCLTPEEYRRAVHSMRLDASLLTALAALTGDSAFLSWRPRFLPVRVDSNVDVPQLVYEHAVICECAHARLRWLRDSTTKLTVPAASLASSDGGRVQAHAETWEDMGAPHWRAALAYGDSSSLGDDLE
jgi:hypothetical protein